MKKNKWVISVISLIVLFYISISAAQTTSFPVSPVDPTVTTQATEYSYDVNSHVTSQHSIPDSREKTAANERRKKEDAAVLPHSFSVAFYKPNYILPYYYTASPYNSIYQGNTPYGESIKGSEFKYQISVKIPLWVDIMQYRTSLYFAYTQLAYWQFYSRYEFIRETNYEPELFISSATDCHVGPFNLDFINVGAVHQSNGVGGDLERTWNRLYVEAILSTEHLMISIKPWYIVHNGDLGKYNPNIGTYLGYERILIAYKLKKHVLALSLRNAIEHYGRYAAGELTWSFPLFTPYLKGYVQAFSGYGQSLIEYNHRTNSIGIGVALNDWI